MNGNHFISSSKHKFNRIWIILPFLFFFSLFALLPLPAYAAAKGIILEINGAIGPATQDYIERGIATAEKEHANIIIIELNTPGGLETSMRGINEDIIRSPIPIITYVAPAGARAASAGTFILYASHANAMAPGTNLGAASPISLTPSANKAKSTEEKKATNDAAAYIRSLAQLRGRNADWGELAVKKAASLPAQEAEHLKVVDMVADNYPQLLAKMDGRTTLVQGKLQKINSKNIQLEKLTPDWRYQFLAFLTNPNVAYILMLIAIYGLFFELSNPGLVLPGVAGIIALLLVLYAFQLMPINYVGLSLILIGIAFMLFEVYVSSFGVIGIGGIIAFTIGSVMLFDMHNPNYHLAWTLVSSMTIVTILFFFMVISLAVRSHKRAIVTGKEGLIGSEGIVLSVMNEQTVVRVLGEIWEAKSSITLDPGQKIKVINVHGLTLEVEPVRSVRRESHDSN